MTELQDILKHLPYKLTAYNDEGHYLYDNGGQDGSFFPSEPEDLPKWIRDEVLSQPEKTVTYPVSTESFDQILMQTYQAALTPDGQVLGFWETIFDLKNPLQTYLDNSAQALVAWSDTTSGASIHIEEESDEEI